MSADAYKDLERAILEYDLKLAESTAKRVVEENLDVMKALDVMTVAVRQVGEAFGKGELWLPDLIGAGDAMSAAVPVLEEAIKKAGQTSKSQGKVVLGTVFGDIHTIGKAMVGTMLVAEGFTVYDVGVNVMPQAFAEAVQKYDADILAMSALLTTTAQEQKKTINLLKELGLRDKVKVLVGGGAITQAFADSIGADGYDPTAPGAAAVARRLMAEK